MANPLDGFPPFHETTSHTSKGLPKPNTAIEEAIAAAEKGQKPQCETTGIHMCKFCGVEFSVTEQEAAANWFEEYG